ARDVNGGDRRQHTGDRRGWFFSCLLYAVSLGGRVQLGVFLFGNVDMPDAGYGGTEPQDRRYGQADVVRQYDDCFAYAQAAERLGYDALWLTEHHFQHEGYEVVPNIVLLSAMIAMKTERIKLGGMFHVIPQWHPLRFAEDFALADVVSR